MKHERNITPTAEQIRIRAEQIRAEWSDEQHEAKHWTKTRRWSVPEVRVGENR